MPSQDSEAARKDLEDMMHEDEVYERHGRLLVPGELQEARAAGLIDFFNLRKGPHYTPAQIIAYLSKGLRNDRASTESATAARRERQSKQPATGSADGPFTPVTMAAHYNVGPGMLYRAIKTQELKAFKLGGKLLRITKEDAEAWFKKHSTLSTNEPQSGAEGAVPHRLMRDQAAAVLSSLRPLVPRSPKVDEPDHD
jgi:hypothetical protein